MLQWAPVLISSTLLVPLCSLERLLGNEHHDGVFLRPSTDRPPLLRSILSSAGFAFIGPLLQRKLRVFDTCGVHNLHGMPALLGSIASCIAAYREGSNPVADLKWGTLQWGYQLACMCIALCMGIVGGIICGFLCDKVL